MLLPGDWVEVKAAAEIERTFDAAGSREALPFMPEMLRACGRRFRVKLRAERTCVYPPERSLRVLQECVVLDDLRCDGSAHGGCELGCRIYWKEAWLQKVNGPLAGAPAPAPSRLALPVTRAEDPAAYVCQGTELVRATTPGAPLWSPGQYLRFLKVGTFTPAEVATMFARRGVRSLSHRAGRLLRSRPAPAPRPRANGALGLEAGEWVEVRSEREILSTLDERGTLGGLAFASDMHVFCGRRMRVLKRVERILSETTGRVRTIRDTVFLEGAVCNRHWGCARGMPMMWREAWLKRVGEART